jgi:hypothetical protein
MQQDVPAAAGGLRSINVLSKPLLVSSIGRGFSCPECGRNRKDGMAAGVDSNANRSETEFVQLYKIPSAG